jgi:hypothetical protein
MLLHDTKIQVIIKFDFTFTHIVNLFSFKAAMSKRFVNVYQPQMNGKFVYPEMSQVRRKDIKKVGEQKIPRNDTIKTCNKEDCSWP